MGKSLVSCFFETQCITYYAYIPVQSVNYCDRLGRCFRFVGIYACTAVFLCCWRFSVNKDLYVKVYYASYTHISGVYARNGRRNGFNFGTAPCSLYKFCYAEKQLPRYWKHEVIGRKRRSVGIVQWKVQFWVLSVLKYLLMRNIHRILLGGQWPLATWGEENSENLTTKWCILKYIWINMWSAQRRSLHLPALIALKI